MSKNVHSKLRAGRELIREPVHVLVVHRDADGAGPEARRAEIVEAVDSSGGGEVVPVIPVRMTEAWLLLDEHAIRTVAGNPRGRHDLSLPKQREIERVTDPKAILRETLSLAADVSGRRKQQFDRRFTAHRRQLLERLDPRGPVSRLASWMAMVAAVDGAVATWCTDEPDQGSGASR